MRLAIDIGNSRTKFALFSEGELVRHVDHPTNESSSSGWQRALESFCGSDAVERAGIASVVPAMTAILSGALHPLIPLVISARMALPFSLQYETPDTLGADRIAAAAAAWQRHGAPGGRSTISIDTGTATTVEVVTSDGVFLGGAILPGPRAMSRALHTATAQLPEVDVDADVEVIGRTTRSAIASGVTYGFVGGIEAILSRTASELPDAPIVVVTGGWSTLLHAHLDADVIVDPHLVLRGIDILLGLNP